VGSEESNIIKCVWPVDETAKDNVVQEPGARYFAGVIVSNKLSNCVMLTSNVTEVCRLESNIVTPWLGQTKLFFKSYLIAGLYPIQQEFRPCQRRKLSSKKF
jgi:hypothetical protein